MIICDSFKSLEWRILIVICNKEFGLIEIIHFTFIMFQKSFVAERTELLETHTKKWDQTMQMRRDKEVDFMKSREKRVDDYEQQLQHLRVQDAEEYNQVKIKLETDVQVSEINYFNSFIESFLVSLYAFYAHVHIFKNCSHD